MKIQYVSDMHMEFRENFSYLSHKQLAVNGDILIVAGDSFYLKDKVKPKARFWQWASERFMQVLLVPGNHEFYGNSDILARGDSWSLPLSENVSYYQNKVVRIDNTDFILSTLWSHINEQSKIDVWYGMNDFRQIVYNGKRFNPDDYNLEFAKDLAFIMKSVENSTAEHIVVVTHHLPSACCVAPEHKDDPLGCAFMTDLTDFISHSRIDYWAYGHSHTNIDAIVGSTHIVSNQLGYVFEKEHKRNGFDFGKYFEI